MGGNQQQLEATIADTMVPTFAISSPRPDRGFEEAAFFSVAPGDCTCPELQQSGLGRSLGTGSSDMVGSPPFLEVHEESFIGRVFGDHISLSSCLSTSTQFHVLADSHGIHAPTPIRCCHECYHKIESDMSALWVHQRTRHSSRLVKDPPLLLHVWGRDDPPQDTNVASSACWRHLTHLPPGTNTP